MVAHAHMHAVLCLTRMPQCSAVTDCVPSTFSLISQSLSACCQDVDPNTPKGAPVVGSCGYGELVRQPYRVCRPPKLIA